MNRHDTFAGGVGVGGGTYHVLSTTHRVDTTTASRDDDDDDDDTAAAAAASEMVFIHPPLEEDDAAAVEDQDGEREPLSLRVVVDSSGMSNILRTSSSNSSNTNSSSNSNKPMFMTVLDRDNDHEDDDEHEDGSEAEHGESPKRNHNSSSNSYSSPIRNTTTTTTTANATKSASSASSASYFQRNFLDVVASQRHRQEQSLTVSQKWTRWIHRSTRRPVTRVVHRITQHAAHRPWLYILSTLVVSLGMFLLGNTVSNINYQQADLNRMTANNMEEYYLSLAPRHGQARQQYDWIEKDSGFHPQDATTRTLSLLLHAHGANVLTKDAVHRVFQAIETVQTTPGYEALCSSSSLSLSSVQEELYYVDPVSGNRTCCHISSVTRFWNHTSTLFKQQVSTDLDVAMALSQPHYPDRTPVDIDGIVGQAVFGVDKILTSAQSFLIQFQLPNIDKTATQDFETRALDRIHAVRNFWKQQDQQQEEDPSYQLEYYSQRQSYGEEFQRAMETDITLLPFVLVVIGLITCLVLVHCNHAVQSRSLLGIGALVSVFLALLTGYGFCFLCRVPFPFYTKILLPFVMIGIGLHQSLLILTEYERTDANKNVVHRIHETMEAVGMSLFVTSVTIALAWILILVTTDIPAIVHLVSYALVTIIVLSWYQLTFFAAVLVLDERRQRIRNHCFVSCSSLRARNNNNKNQIFFQRDPYDEAIAADTALDQKTRSGNKETVPARITSWYAHQLFSSKPWVKMTVVTAFVGLVGVQLYHATLLEQGFNVADTVPAGSYVTSYWDAFQNYTRRGGGITTHAYFRNVNQSDHVVQDLMLNYIDDLVTSMPGSGSTAAAIMSDPPPYFWLNDYILFTSRNEVLLWNMTFAETLNVFLSPLDIYRNLYQDDIVRDAQGNIQASRVLLYLDKVPHDSIPNQVRALQHQERIAREQLVNRGITGYDFFFTFDKHYLQWEYYSVAASEWTTNIFASLTAVSLVTLVLIPHWTAVLFMLPTAAMVYVNILGWLQLASVGRNVVSHMALILSIGLIVPYTMHVLLRYYESKEPTRAGKVQDMLVHTGPSLLVSGLVLLVGILPLAFSTSAVFGTMFVTYLSLVAIGAGHGLIFLPAVLSLWGPTDMLAVDCGGRQEQSFLSTRSLVAASLSLSSTAPAPTLQQQKWAAEIASLRRLNSATSASTSAANPMRV